MLNRQILATRVHDARLRLALTQTELAGRARLSQSHISELEHADAIYTPSVECLLRLARALGCTVGWLLGEDG